MYVYTYIYIYIWRFPKIRGTFLGVPNKDYGILLSISGSPSFGKLPYIHIYIYTHIVSVLVKGLGFRVTGFVSRV